MLVGVIGSRICEECVLTDAQYDSDPNALAIELFRSPGFLS